MIWFQIPESKRSLWAQWLYWIWKLANTYYFAFRFSEIQAVRFCEAEECLGQRMWTKEKSEEMRNLVDDRWLPHGSVEITAN